MFDADNVSDILRKATETYGERFALAVALELAYEANAAAAPEARNFNEPNPDERRRIETAIFYRNLLTTTPEAVNAAIKAVIESGEFNNLKKD